MKFKKILLPFMSVFLTAGLRYGCNVNEDEPEPSEEPSEQREDNSQ